MTTPARDLADPRRASLVRQARSHFIAKGYAGARMEPIARAAGVSTATLYIFFSSKAVLFEAVIEEVAEEFSRQTTAVPVATGAPRDRLVEILDAYAVFMSDGFVHTVFGLIMEEHDRCSAIAAAIFEYGRRDFGAVLMTVLAEMTQAGQLSVSRPSWTTGQLMGMIEHPLFSLPLTGGREAAADRSPRQIAEDAVDVILARYGV